MLKHARVLLVGVVLAAVVLPASSAGAVAGYGDVADDRYFTAPVQWSVDGGSIPKTADFDNHRLWLAISMLTGVEYVPGAPEHCGVRPTPPANTCTIFQGGE